MEKGLAKAHQVHHLNNIKKPRLIKTLKIITIKSTRVLTLTLNSFLIILKKISSDIDITICIEIINNAFQ